MRASYVFVKHSDPKVDDNQGWQFLIDLKLKSFSLHLQFDFVESHPPLVLFFNESVTRIMKIKSSTETFHRNCNNFCIPNDDIQIQKKRSSPFNLIIVGFLNLKALVIQYSEIFAKKIPTKTQTIIMRFAKKNHLSFDYDDFRYLLYFFYNILLAYGWNVISLPWQTYNYVYCK